MVDCCLSSTTQLGFPPSLWPFLKSIKKSRRAPDNNVKRTPSDSRSTADLSLLLVPLVLPPVHFWILRRRMSNPRLSDKSSRRASEISTMMIRAVSTPKSR